MSHPAVTPVATCPARRGGDRAGRSPASRTRSSSGTTTSTTVALVGIHTRGVPLAQRLRRLVEERSGDELALGQLDITFHRDDVHVRAGQAPRRPQPLVRDTKLDFELEGRTVILVDDVLYTGRTIRAAIDALFEYGRPDARAARRARRPRPPRAADPPRLRRQEPADDARRARPGRAGRDRRGRPRRARPERRRSRPMTDLRVVGGELLPPRGRAPPPALDRRPRRATTSSACSRRHARSRCRRSATTRSCRRCAAGSS